MVGSKYVWLRNPEKMCEQQKIGLNKLMAGEFNTGQAWALKNPFRIFWQLGCAGSRVIVTTFIFTRYSAKNHCKRMSILLNSLSFLL